MVLAETAKSLEREAHRAGFQTIRTNGHRVLEHPTTGQRFSLPLDGVRASRGKVTTVARKTIDSAKKAAPKRRKERRPAAVPVEPPPPPLPAEQLHLVAVQKVLALDPVDPIATFTEVYNTLTLKDVITWFGFSSAGHVQQLIRLWHVPLKRPHMAGPRTPKQAKLAPAVTPAGERIVYTELAQHIDHERLAARLLEDRRFRASTVEALLDELTTVLVAHRNRRTRKR